MAGIQPTVLTRREDSLGPPKSKAARRVVGIPAVIIPALRDHLAAFVKPEPDALVFLGPMGGPMRRRKLQPGGRVVVRNCRDRGAQPAFA